MSVPVEPKLPDWECSLTKGTGFVERPLAGPQLATEQPATAQAEVRSVTTAWFAGS
jgi:hypothetical protein